MLELVHRVLGVLHALRCRGDLMAQVVGILAAHATPEETAAFATWLIATAQAAADAAKDGGFMGFGAKQVSDGEQAMLDRLRETLT